MVKFGGKSKGMKKVATGKFAGALPGSSQTADSRPKKFKTTKSKGVQTVKGVGKRTTGAAKSAGAMPGSDITGRQRSGASGPMPQVKVTGKRMKAFKG